VDAACATIRTMSLAALLLAAASAAAGDPLAEPACRAAMDALAAREADPANRAALAAARQRAAQDCLRTHADPPQPERRPQPPLAVPSAVVPAPPLRAPAAVPPPIPRRAEPPPSVIACDATSCLTSDGQRLPKSGPVLTGPQGSCRDVAGVLTCP